jgi:hypothetical protein
MCVYKRSNESSIVAVYERGSESSIVAVYERGDESRGRDLCAFQKQGCLLDLPMSPIPPKTVELDETRMSLCMDSN